MLFIRFHLFICASLYSENCDIQKRSFDQSKSRPSKQQVLSLAFEIIFDFQEPISTLVVETRTWPKVSFKTLKRWVYENVWKINLKSLRTLLRYTYLSCTNYFSSDRFGKFFLLTKKVNLLWVDTLLNCFEPGEKLK